MDEFLTDFLIECSENLSKIDNDLLLLEKGDKEVLSNIFRAIHTVKGSCGMFGFQRLEHLAHVTEDVLGKMREGSLEPSPFIVGKVLQSIDIIKNILAVVEKDKTEPKGSDEEIINELKMILNAEEASVKADQPAPAAATHLPKSEIIQASTGPQATENTLRVNIEVLDGLMNAIGELVLSRNRLMQLTRTGNNSVFFAPIQHLNRVTSGLQEAVMKTRMQPIGNAWAKLPRIVRDLCASSGKRIEVVMKGQATEIDRQVLQAIQDPLIHCVRNSADHGIEMPDARLQNGKDPQGTITLNAFHEGGKIVIEISDDGAGVNVEAVKEKAIERGLVTREAADKMNDSQISKFIFEAGFSTAKQVTEVSGRGVGMDVVKNNIEKISGTINLSTERNAGTCLRIEIPLTLAIIQALVVKARGDDVFAIPQMNIVEVVRSDGKKNIENIHGSRFLKLRENLLPLVDLGHVLGLTDKEPFSFLEEWSECMIIIVRAGIEHYGLCVQDISDMHEIVVKPLGKLLREINLYAGSTILGDGSVVIILDIPKIVSQFVKKDDARDEIQQDQSLEIKGDKTSFLLFKAGDGVPKAVPLALVSRLEEIHVKKIEHVNDAMMVQYLGKLLRLIPCENFTPDLKAEKVPAIIFSDGKKTMGLLVEQIIDVIEDNLILEGSRQKGGVVGAAIINGRATEIIDTYHYLQTAFPDWFDSMGTRKDQERYRILYVEDSSFFRNLLVPVMEANGYEVFTAINGAQALQMLESGLSVDFILTDIEMPEMDGLTLARRIKAHPNLKRVPIVALTTLSSTEDRQKGKDAGLDDYLVKFDQDVLLQTLKATLTGAPA